MLVKALRHSCLTPSDVLLPLFHLKTGRKNAVEIKPWNRHGPIGTKLCSYPWWGFPSDAWLSAWLLGRGSENAFVGDKKKKKKRRISFSILRKFGSLQQTVGKEKQSLRPTQSKLKIPHLSGEAARDRTTCRDLTTAPFDWKHWHREANPTVRSWALGSGHVMSSSPRQTRWKK